jgi:hypothetical protein
MPAGFVVHSLRHTMPPRLGMLGAVSNPLPPRVGVGIELGIDSKNAVRKNRRKVLK